MTMRSRSARIASKLSGRVGGLGGQRRLDLARRGPRHHRMLRHAGAVVRDAVDDLVPQPAEFFRIHGTSSIFSSIAASTALRENGSG